MIVGQRSASGRSTFLLHFRDRRFWRRASGLVLADNSAVNVYRGLLLKKESDRKGKQEVTDYFLLAHKA